MEWSRPAGIILGVSGEDMDMDYAEEIPDVTFDDIGYYISDLPHESHVTGIELLPR